MKRILSLTLFVAAALFILTWSQAGAAAVTSNNLDWSTPQTLSAAPQGATGPDLAVSGNGQLLLVYTHQAAGGDNPYYRLSINNGLNWTPAATIHNSSNDSTQVFVTFDSSNNAHAVWIENNNQIRHARQSQWPGNTSTLISTSSGFIPVLDRPRIIANGTNRLDMVWAEANDGVGNNTPDIYHTYSTNNGQSWQPPTPVALTFPSSLVPALAAAHDGRLHLVWAEAKGGGFNEIAYAQGTISGGTVTWSAPLIISDASLEDTNNPQVLVHNGVVNVFYTRRETRLVNGQPTIDQYVDRLTCSTNCAAAAANWSAQGVSGARLGANTQDPFNVASAAIAHQGCLYSYFHGTSDQFGDNNEIVWGTNSCAGWASSAPDMVTAQNHRSMFPTLASQGQWLLLAYESGPEGANRQIIFRRVLIEAKLYLPIIYKN
jgi:hypothetical protein